MAGRGPTPKDPSRRARRNVDPNPGRTMRLIRQEAPPLPSLGIDKDGFEIPWHPRTVDWWDTWCESELSNDFTASDWSFLLDTALMHHAMWSRGQWTLAAEVRLRVAKFGATPEDRARLRITFEDADAAEDRGRERRRRNAAAPGPSGPDPRSILGDVG